jgi:hypothetical protein
LGMYTVATMQMAEALDLPFLTPLPRIMFAAALGAWMLACIGLLWELRKLFHTRKCINVRGGSSESALGTCVMPKLKRPAEALEEPLQ